MPPLMKGGLHGIRPVGDVNMGRLQHRGKVPRDTSRRLSSLGPMPTYVIPGAKATGSQTLAQVVTGRTAVFLTHAQTKSPHHECMSQSPLVPITADPLCPIDTTCTAPCEEGGDTHNKGRSGDRERCNRHTGSPCMVYARIASSHQQPADC